MAKAEFEADLGKTKRLTWKGQDRTSEARAAKGKAREGNGKIMPW